MSESVFAFPIFHCVDARNAALAKMFANSPAALSYSRTIFSKNEIPDGQTYKRSLVEIIGYTSGLASAVDVLPQNPAVRLHPVWLANEICGYVDAAESRPAISAWLPEVQVRRYHNLDETGNIVRNYGYTPERIQRVIRMLQDEPETKRCLVSFYDPGWLAPAEETPCALTTQYLLRRRRWLDNAPELWTINTYRSHDFFAGVRMDPIRISVVQQAVAHALGVLTGPLIFQEGSLHYYPERPHVALERVADWNCARDHQAFSPFMLFPHPTDDPIGQLRGFATAFRQGPERNPTCGNSRLDGILQAALTWWLEHRP